MAGRVGVVGWLNRWRLGGGTGVDAARPDRWSGVGGVGRSDGRGGRGVWRRRLLAGVVGGVVGLGAAGVPVLPVVVVEAAEVWVGSVDVVVDRLVVDAVDGSATVSVAVSSVLFSPYVLSLYDDTGKRLAYCKAGGTACRDGWSVGVSVPNDVTRVFKVFVGVDYPSKGFPSSGVVASGEVMVVNVGWTGSLSVLVDRPVVDAVDGSVNVLVEPSMGLVSPYVLSLYDETGKRVAYCGASSSSCRDGWVVKVSVPNGVVRSFTGFVAQDYPSKGPPVRDVRVSGSVLVTNQGWTGSLVVLADRVEVGPGDPSVVLSLKTSMRLVSPYYLSLYDETGKRVAYCSGSSSSCRDGWVVKVAIPNGVVKTFTGFVAQDYPSKGSPVKDVRVTGQVSVRNTGWLGSLMVWADHEVVDVADPKTVISVETSVPLAGSYVLSLYDDTGKRLAYCKAGSQACSGRWDTVVTVPNDLTAAFSVFVAEDYPSKGPPVKDVRASERVTVTNTGWTGVLDMLVDRPVVDVVFAEASVTVTASSRLAAPYVLSVYDDTGKRLGYCRAASCKNNGLTVKVKPLDGQVRTYTGFVAQDYPTAGPPVKDRRTANSVQVVHAGWAGNVTVSVEERQLPVDVGSALVSVVTDRVVPAPYTLALYVKDGERLWSCNATACRSKGGSVTVDVPVGGGVEVVGVVVKGNAPEVSPPAGGVFGSGGVLLTREAWLGSVGVSVSYLDLDAGNATNGGLHYSVLVETVFEPRLPADLELAVYTTGGRLVTTSTAWYSSQPGVKWSRYFDTPETDTGFLVVVGPDYPVDHLPDKVWASAGFGLRASGRAWSGDVSLVDVSTPGSSARLLEVVLSDRLSSMFSRYRLIVEDEVGVLVGQCGAGTYVDCGTSTRFSVQVPTGQTWSYRARVVQQPTSTYPVVLGVAKVSEDVVLSGPLWPGEVTSFSVAGGGVDPVSGVAGLVGVISELPILGDSLVIVDENYQLVKDCGRMVSCVVDVVVGFGDGPKRYWLMVVAGGWRGAGTVAGPGGEGLVISSRQVFVDSLGWVGVLRVSADTGLVGVVDESGPVVNLTVQTRDVVADGWTVYGCDQEGRLMFRQDADGSTWSGKWVNGLSVRDWVVSVESRKRSSPWWLTDFQWRVDTETVGLLTVRLDVTGSGCTPSAEVVASQVVDVENVGWTGIISLDVVTQPSARTPDGVVMVSTSRRIPDGYQVDLVEVNPATGVVIGQLETCRSVCAQDAAVLFAEPVKALKSRSFQARVYRYDRYREPAGRITGSDIVTVTHPGWRGTVTLDVPVTETHNSAQFPVVAYLSEPLGDATLSICSPWPEGYIPGGLECLTVTPILPERRSQSVFWRNWSVYQRGEREFQAAVYYPDGGTGLDRWAWPMRIDGRVEGVTGVHKVVDLGWEGDIYTFIQPLPPVPGGDYMDSDVSVYVVTVPAVPFMGWGIDNLIVTGQEFNWWCNHSYYECFIFGTGVFFGDYPAKIFPIQACVVEGNPGTDPGLLPAIKCDVWQGFYNKTVLAEYWCGINPALYWEGRCIGDPVATMTGEWWESETDLDMAGVGPPVEHVRSFSTFGRDRAGPFGEGWRSNLEMRITPADGQRVALGQANGLWVEQENGSIAVFWKRSDGRYATSDRTKATLEILSDGGYRFTRNKSEVFLFDAAGRLTGLVDMNNNRVSVQWEGEILRGVVDGQGRFVRFTWNHGHVTAATDQTGRQVVYTYDSLNRISQVRFADGTIVGYSYDGEGRVRRITNPSGQTITNTYDESDRVISQVDSVLGETSFVYEPQATLITHPDGMVTKEEYYDHLLLKVTDGYGTREARTTSYSRTHTDKTLITAVTDQFGNRTRYTYDQDRNPTSVTSAAGRRTNMFYDQVGYLSETRSPMGKTTYTGFDQAGNLTWARDAAGNTTRMSLNPDGTLASMTDPLAADTIYSYDPYGQVIGERTPMGVRTAVSTDSLGRVLSETSPDGLVTIYGYNLQGGLASVTTPDGLRSTFEYAADTGLLVKQTDPLGQVTRYSYDLAGRPVTVTTVGVTTRYTYDLAGQVSSVTRSSGTVISTWCYSYNQFGEVVTETDPLGRVTSYTYDRLGQLVRVIDPAGGVTSYGYGSSGELIWEVDPAGLETTYMYDPDGNQVGVSDSTGYYMATIYNAVGLPVKASEGSGDDPTLEASWVYAYDQAGQVVNETSPDGLTTTTSYDLDGRVDNVTDPVSGSTTYTYDVAGRLDTVTDAVGVTAAYVYDGLSRLIGVDYPATTSDINYTYNQYSQIVAVSDGTVYEYDQSGRVIEVRTPGGVTSYSYDSVNRLHGITYPDGSVVTYSYNLADELVEVADSVTGSYLYSYDQAGRVSGLVYPNGVTTSYIYDQASRLVSSTTTGPAGVVLTLEQSFEADGLLAGSSTTRNTNQTATAGYSWDPLRRLNQITYGGDDGSGDGGGVLSFTPGGTLTGVDTGWSFTTDPLTGQLNQAESPAGVTVTYQFDQVGNRVSEHSTTGTTTYGYGPSGRLASVSMLDGSTWVYTYDAAGLRSTATPTSITSGGRVEHYVWDQVSTSVPLLLTDGRAAYVYGAGSSPLAQRSDERTTSGGGGSSQDEPGWLCFHGDVLGSIRAVTDATGMVVAGSDYTAYGEPLTVEGLPPVVTVTRFGFAGEWVDPTGLMYLRARYYDPATGVFLTVDPAVDLTGDAYGYAAGNPLQLTDPLGLWSFGFDPTDILADLTNLWFGLVNASNLGAPAGIVNYLGWDNKYLDSCSTMFQWGKPLEFVIEIVASLIGAGSGIVARVLAKVALRRTMAAAARGTSTIAGRRMLMSGAGHSITGAGRGGIRGLTQRLTRSGCSFTPDTPVLSVDGTSIPIGEIQTGDQVVSADPLTSQTSASTVKDIYPHQDTLIGLTVGGEQITTTASHPWWNQTTQTWTPTAQLNIGDELLTAAGVLQPVQNITPIGISGPVIDLTVTPTHTYQVGDNQVLAHNCPVGGLNTNTLGSGTRNLGKNGLTSQPLHGAWKSTAPSSKTLANNMLKRWPQDARPPETAAHHIVAGRAWRAADARKVLDRFHIDINDPMNGIFLPRFVNSRNPLGYAVHSRIHTRAYYKGVNRMLQRATSGMEVSGILRSIRQDLILGKFP